MGSKKSIFLAGRSHEHGYFTGLSIRRRAFRHAFANSSIVAKLMDTYPRGRDRVVWGHGERPRGRDRLVWSPGEDHRDCGWALGVPATWVEAMAEEEPKDRQPIAWLLLPPEQKSAPIYGLSPEDIRASRKAGGLRYPRGLDLIVEALGFEGGFGRYQREHWPQVEAFMRMHHLANWENIFPESSFYFNFYLDPHQGPTRRQLADRLFLGPPPMPKRVFVGSGVDWKRFDFLRSKWRRIHLAERLSYDLPPDLKADPTLVAELRDLSPLFEHDGALLGQWGFLDDKLLSGPVKAIVDKLPWMGVPNLSVALKAFRGLVDGFQRGWVDVLPINDALAFLKSGGGAWDLVWRELREGPVGGQLIQGRDLPQRFHHAAECGRRLYLRTNVWDEEEALAAEVHYYEQGGSFGARENLQDVEVRGRYLIARGVWTAPMRPSLATPPNGFKEVEVDDKRLLISELISLDTYKRMLSETGYLKRRPASDQPWERANPASSGLLPAGASWHDAVAWCAWKESVLGAQVRLPTKAELLAIRPIQVERPPKGGRRDEQWGWTQDPPEPTWPLAVVWSEPWTEVIDGRKQRRWIEDYPPRASWSAQLPWKEYRGLRFIDAGDTGEWCEEEELIGRYWDIHVGGWGAYKQIKATFRVVIDLGS